MKGDGISRIERRYAGLVDLMRRKNAGYAGASQDEWVNFRAIEPLATAEVGLMARLGDKWNRLRSLMKNPANDQVGEDVQETIDDMINYLAIMGDIIYERQLYNAKALPEERIAEVTQETAEAQRERDRIGHRRTRHIFWCLQEDCPAFNSEAAGQPLPEGWWIGRTPTH